MEKVIKGFVPFLQRDFGKDYDCTLCSVAAVCYNDKELNRSKTKHFVEIYNMTEKRANKLFYNGDKYGFISVFIKKLFNQVIYDLTSKMGNTKSGYIKGIGFNYKKICSVIDKDIPVILNMIHPKYKSHTVTVIGYNTEDNQLIIQDNWNREKQTIYYKDINCLSSINYQ